MELNELLASLENEWDIDEGFLGMLRKGKFSELGLYRLLKLIDPIDIEDQEVIDRRLASLIWYIPIFMGWQKERTEENGIPLETLNLAITEVVNRLENVLGVP